MSFAPQTSVTPPIAARHPHLLRGPFGSRDDEYYWIGDRQNPDALAYLEAENAYADAVFEPTTALQANLIGEMKSRATETDIDAPIRQGAYWYWARSLEGKQYPQYCRRYDPDFKVDLATLSKQAQAEAERIVADSQIPDASMFLDANLLASGSDYFSLGVWDMSPDQTVLAYGIDRNGSEKFELRFLDVASGEDLPESIVDVARGSAWSSHGSTFFYVRPDASMRPYQVWRHVMGEPPSRDTLVWEESDERFALSVDLSRSGRYVVIESQSKRSSECLWLDASDPNADPQVILPRTPGVEYDVEHAEWPGEGDVWLVRTNRPGPDGDSATDFEVLRMPVGGGDLVEILGHRPGTRVDFVHAFATFVAIGERGNGLPQIRILSLTNGTAELVPQPEVAYGLSGVPNAGWNSTSYRFGYNSFSTPMSVIEVDTTTGQRDIVWTQQVRGYDPTQFVSHRTWATARDGTQIPISLVARADVPVDGTASCLMYAYGAFEQCRDPDFFVPRLNLLERGVVYAIANVRGGGEMGRTWHEKGRMQNKINTFTDFIDCAEHLIDGGWVAPDRLAATGGSAGGMLMGAVSNMRPDLWRAVVAKVAFVDVLTTISDPALPLTVTEWEEWGNPLENESDYRYMRSYSPYDNVARPTDDGHRVSYPPMYVTAGLNDPRTGYWEPTKWVARLRANVANRYPLLLRTELGAGHGGASGRYDVWQEEARIQAFLITALGLDG